MINAIQFFYNFYLWKINKSCCLIIVKPNAHHTFMGLDICGAYMSLSIGRTGFIKVDE
jgi:hypothetical protein